MNSKKEELIQWIDAYAAARASNNTLLTQLATSNLNAFIQSIDVLPAGTQVAQPEDNQEAPQPATRVARTTRTRVNKGNTEDMQDPELF